MKVYDTAKWQLEGGIPADKVARHFTFVFEWLRRQKMLSKDGMELLDLGMDDSASLNEDMVNAKGREYLDYYYDDYLKEINYGVSEDEKWLNSHLKDFLENGRKRSEMT